MTTAPCEHCGGYPSPKRGKPRSVPQHRRYFAMIRAAFHHWPEAHEFHPVSEEHLRRWCQAKAGHRVVNAIETDSMTPAQAVLATSSAIKAAGPFSFVSAVGSTLYVITSSSIDFNTLPHLAACALFDDVADVIEAETGLKVDDIMPPVRARATPRERQMGRQAT